MSDDYARKFMGGENVRFLDKVKVPPWMHALLLAGPIAGIVGAVGGGVPLLGLVVGAFGVVTWGLLTTIRVSVTDTDVYIQYGLWGPKIALSHVVDVEVIDYQWTRYGGWGIRGNLRGERAFSVPGRGGRAVQIKYREANGKQRTVVVSSEQPDALKMAIDQARGAAASATLDTVASTSTTDTLTAEERAQAEAEIEAVLKR